MVDLPSVPNRLVTTEAARSSVTAADIAAPYKSLGNALDNLGEGLEDVSVVVAEKAAQTAVTRDADGNLQVEQLPPMMGKAGAAYNRIAKQGYLAQLEDQANTQITKARADYAGRPEEFKSWSDKYLGELVSKQPDETLQNAVHLAVGRRLTQTYDGLITQRAHLDLQRNNAAIDAQILSSSDDIEMLARKGGAGTPEFAARLKDFEHLLDEKVNNPAIAFPREKADRLRDEVMTRAYGAAILDGVEKTYREKGFQAARATLRDAVKALGPSSGAPDAPATGLLEAGNIDLNRRPVVKNADGSISTVRSISINEDGKEILIPTVAADGSGILSDKEAIEQYKRTGQFLGKFDTPENATAYAESLHSAQASYYGGPRLKDVSKIERQGLAWLRSEEAGFRGERDAISREWSAARGQADTLPRDTLLDMQERARAVGNVRVDQDIAVRLAALDTVSALRGLPAADRANIAITGKVNLPLVDRIVGAESGANPSAVNPNSSAAGVGQFVNGTWLGLIKKYRPELAAGHSDAELLALRTSKAPEAVALNREMVGRYAEDNGRSLQAAGVPVNDATLYLAHFLGPGDAAKVAKADAAQSVVGLVNSASLAANREVFSKNPTAGDLVAWAGRKVGVGEADLTKSREGLVALGMLKREIAKDIGDRITGLQNAVAKQEIPDAAEAEALLVQVHAVGTPEQQKKVAELAAISSIGADFNKLPADKRAALVSAMAEKGRKGASGFERNLSAALQKADGAINTAYNNDPYGAAYRYADVQPLAPVDWSNPGTAAATIKAKVAQQNAIRADQNMGPFSVLRPSEAAAFGGVLANGDAATVSSGFAVLGSLNNDLLFATLDSGAIKESVSGAMRSTDPAKYTAVMTALDGVYGRDPGMFTKLFGTEATHKLMTWQSVARYYDAKTLASERARAADDPQVLARRKVNEAEGLKLARAKSVDDVVASFNDSVFPSFIAQDVTGSAPRAPIDSGTRDALMGDYETLFARRYAETLDEQTAHKQSLALLKTKWSRSETNGGRLMLRAPETVYPAVDGSHAWMEKQFEEMLTGQLGPRYGGDWRIPSLAPGVPTPNWTASLVPDRRTETEAQRGLPASYQVVVMNHRTGKTDALRDGSGQELRLSFDPSAAQEAVRAAFTARRQGLNALLPTRPTQPF